MALHLIKLCVGAESLDDLADWIDRKLRQRQARGEPAETGHVTRMIPTRRAELLDGGSLYWVIRGAVQVRQRLSDIRPFVDDEGIRRCRLVLDPDLVPTRRQPRRPFQGWRYLKAEDAPLDLAVGRTNDLPAHLEAELAELGLL
jgi:hypothetical protein